MLVPGIFGCDEIDIDIQIYRYRYLRSTDGNTCIRIWKGEKTDYKTLMHYKEIDNDPNKLRQRY